MSSSLNVMIKNINSIHEHLLKNQQIDNLEYILEYIEDYGYDEKEQYLKILLRYYFQNNQLENFKELYLLGYRFELELEDIKSVIIRIDSEKKSVIDFLQDDVLFTKYKDYDKFLKDIYLYYQSANDDLKVHLNSSINLLRKNIYVCAFSYKNRKQDYAQFFLDESLLISIKDNLPFIFE